MKLQTIPISKILPNSWNSNEMPPKLFTKLVEKIKRVGYTQPIEVRPVDDPKLGLFQIVDGEHRFLACKEAGLDKIECVVSAYSDAEAKTETLAKNKLRGEFDPVKTGALLAELSEELGLPELEELSGFEKSEIEDLISLGGEANLDDIFGKINDDSSLQIKEIRFACKADDLEFIESILAKIKKSLKPKLSGEILLKLCETYEKLSD